MQISHLIKKISFKGNIKENWNFKKVKWLLKLQGPQGLKSTHSKHRVWHILQLHPSILPHGVDLEASEKTTKMEQEQSALIDLSDQMLRCR